MYSSNSLGKWELTQWFPSDTQHPNTINPVCLSRVYKKNPETYNWLGEVFFYKETFTVFIIYRRSLQFEHFSL